MNYGNMMDTTEDSFGPGTDLVFSLVALLLIVIPVILQVQSRTDFLNRLYAVRLHHKQSDYGATTAQLQQQIKNLQEKYKELTDENQRQKRRIDSLANERKTLLARNQLLQKLDTANITDLDKYSLLQANLDQLQQEKAKIAARLAASTQEIARLRQRYRRDKPPIIPLQEASGYTFKTAGIELSSRFKQRLTRDIIPQLRSIVDKYHVNTIEIVGHTDSVPVSYGKRSNLDTKLEAVYHHRGSLKELHFSSNTELGLLRALAVKNFLEDNLHHELPGVSFRIYSAAQLVPVIRSTSRHNHKNNAADRRIELRFTRLGQGGA